MNNVTIEVYQDLIRKWGENCFNYDLQYFRDPIQRSFRFAEESIELFQSLGITKNELHQLIESIYSRPTGKSEEEVGGVMVTLAALCSAMRISLEGCAQAELIRINQPHKIQRIRQRHSKQQRGSPVMGE